jgi:hypothetical protein
VGFTRAAAVAVDSTQHLAELLEQAAAVVVAVELIVVAQMAQMELQTQVVAVVVVDQKITRQQYSMANQADQELSL